MGQRISGPGLRWWLAAALLAPLAVVAADRPPTPGPPPPSHEAATSMRIYVGTYTRGASQGIYVVGFDPASGRFTGTPELAGRADQPSYLALHPNGRVLYAVNELQTFQGRATGAVSAFAIDASGGRLTLLNQQASEGTDPCHVTVDRAGRHVLVANYSSGTTAVLPVGPDGSLQPASSVRQRSGSGPVQARQAGPHAHMILLDPAERFAYSVDLGADRVFIDRYDGAAGRLTPNEPDAITVEAGSGPRHAAWHPSGRVLYLLNELQATVAAFRVDAARGTLTAFQTVPARAAGARGDNSGAAIVVSPDGRFVYASNRGDDTVAVFAVDASTHGLTAAGHVPTGGRVPRSIAIDPSGRWLIAANQRSGSLVVFRLDPATGLPEPTGVTAAVADPVCVLFAAR